MNLHLGGHPSEGERGQVLVLFALMLVAFLGFAALAIDVGRVYAQERFQRSVADAASLAGGQDLQELGTRNVTLADYARARTHALQSVEYQLGATSPSGCDPTIDIVGCAIQGTPYTVNIRTNPSPTCVTCDPDRSVQVTVVQSSFGLTFAQIFGQSSWRVAATSVAGINYGAHYAVITLRPPKPLRSGLDQNEKDVDVNGTGTSLSITNGDIGSNTNATITGSGSAVNLDPGFLLYHYDTYQAWVGSPKGKTIPTWILDPNYTVPQPTVLTPTFNNDPQAEDTTTCGTEIAKAVAAGYAPPATPVALSAANVACYKPGIYQFDIKDQTNGHVTLLEPGVYFFDSGLTMKATLIAGYEPAKPGIVMVFPESNTVTFAGNNSQLISINAGSRLGDPVGGQEASPAIGWDGNPVSVDFGTGASPQVVPLSIVVIKDPNCYPAATDPVTCNESMNQVINLPGGGSLYIAGVQYAPTDNMTINGGSGGVGKIGQIVAWTVQYTGGSKVSEQYPGGIGNGVLRIDQGCSEYVACNNP